MNSFRQSVLGGIMILALVPWSACAAAPSAEELQEIESLKLELEDLQAEVSNAETKSATLAGGLVKTLIEVRLETLKNTRALVRERIHALESGAKIVVETVGTKPDEALASRLGQEIAIQERKLKESKDEAARYTGGLVAAMKSTTVATEEQSLAMLRQRFLIAKYGLRAPSMHGASTTDESSDRDVVTGSALPEESTPSQDILQVTLLKKKFAEQNYQEYIFFDLEFTAIGLQKPARAIKGVLLLQDLFGESKMKINWTLDKPTNPGGRFIEKGTGFKYNQFMSEHQWVRSTELEDMTASFAVRSILYQDGSREDL